MYLAHYNLNEKPFQLTSDPRFLWLGEKYEEALARLKYSILERTSFLVMTGHVGTGKTTLINGLLRQLDSHTLVATVRDPSLEKLEFLNFLAYSFHIKNSFATKLDFLIHFTKFLKEKYLDRKRVLIIIDEAHKLSHEMLEEIRLLSNIEREDQKLLSVFFVGQNEFDTLLMDKESYPLRQRINIRYHLEPLTEEDTKTYIEHRLKVAGTEETIFTKKAIREIHQYSEGYPRLINVFCDNALLSGYVQNLSKINGNIIHECARELIGQTEKGPDQSGGNGAKGPDQSHFKARAPEQSANESKALEKAEVESLPMEASTKQAPAERNVSSPKKGKSFKAWALLTLFFALSLLLTGFLIIINQETIQEIVAYLRDIFPGL